MVGPISVVTRNEKTISDFRESFLFQQLAGANSWGGELSRVGVNSRFYGNRAGSPGKCYRYAATQGGRYNRESRTLVAETCQPS
jgi:hypothetical protein